MILAVELSFAAILTAAFIFLYFRDFDFDSAWICFSGSALLLSVALGVIFWQLSALNRQVKGVFCNSKLMLVHFLAFFGAATCDIVIGIVQSVNTRIYRHHGSTNQVERLNIVVDIFIFLQTIGWFICQCIMLYVFFKFGQPVEKDAMRLFRSKLETIYQDQNDPRVRQLKRQREVDLPILST